MTAHPRDDARRRCLPAALALCALTLATACSGGGGPETVSADSPLLLEASANAVTFTNRAGLTLVDVSITIVPYGPTEFTKLLTRVENTGRREVPLTEFRGRDGTPLSLRVVRPKAVRARAQDSTGKTYEAEIPWR
jgi:hypothetical protein